MSLIVKTEPAEETITVAEAKAQLNLDGTDHDTIIGTMITAVRIALEDALRVTFVSKTYTWHLDHFPTRSDPLMFPMPRLTAVTHIKYKEQIAGTLTTWDSSKYLTDFNSFPGRVTPTSAEDWPSTFGEIDDVQIEFVAGFANAAAVTENFKAALKERVCHLFINREQYVVGQGVHAIPEGAARVVKMQGDFRFGAND